MALRPCLGMRKVLIRGRSGEVRGEGKGREEQLEEAEGKDAGLWPIFPDARHSASLLSNDTAVVRTSHRGP